MISIGEFFILFCTATLLVGVLFLPQILFKLEQWAFKSSKENE